MVIERPSAKRDLILEDATVGDISLRYHIFTDHPSGFALSRKEAEEIKLPFFAVKLSRILDIVPSTGCKTEKLIAKFFRIIVSMHGSNTENDFPEPGLPMTKRPRSIATMLIHPLFTLPLYTYLVGRLTDV